MTAFLGRALSWDVRDAVLEVRLHRAPCNEIGTVALDELERLVATLPSLDVRALLIYSGLDSGFCAGADLRELQEGLRAQRQDSPAARGVDAARRAFRALGLKRGHGVAGRVADRAYRHVVRREVGRFIDRIHTVFDALDTLPIPVIAAVHGPVFGGGFELALTADLIVADKSARFCFPELRLGIVPGFGGVPRLEREVGNAVVRDLLLTGRSIGATRAHELGLVSQVVARGQALSAARRVADQAARFDPEVVAQAKAFVKPLPKARLEEEKRRFVQMITAPRVAAALDAFVTRNDVRPYLP